MCVAAASSSTGSVSNCFIENNFDPTHQVPDPTVTTQPYEITDTEGPLEGGWPAGEDGWKTFGETGDYDTWNLPEPATGGGPQRGEIPGWKEFEDKAWKDWEKLNQRIQRLRDVMEQNRQELEKWKALQLKLAGQATDQAKKTWSTFTEGAKEELMGQFLGALGDSSEVAGNLLDLKEYADHAGTLTEDGFGKLMEDLIKAPTGMFWWLGDTMDNYFKTRGLGKDLDHINGLIQNVNQAQQQLDQLVSNMEAEKERLGQAIENVNKGWFNDSDREAALNEFNQSHDTVSFLTGPMSMNTQIITPGKTSHVPGVTQQYWNYQATFVVLPASK